VQCSVEQSGAANPGYDALSDPVSLRENTIRKGVDSLMAGSGSLTGKPGNISPATAGAGLLMECYGQYGSLGHDGTR